MMMLHAAYKALWYPALPFALLASGGGDPAVRAERTGDAPAEPAAAGSGAPRIWLHAASVGEIEGVRPLALSLLHDFPRAALYVTTMTAAGREAARRRIPGAASVAFAPLDHAPFVRRFLAALRPRLVLIAETELWPNYFLESRRAGAKVAMINGRISDRSFLPYAFARGLFAHALRAADLVMAQSQADAARFMALGAPAKRVMVTGNAKFDRPEFDSGAPPLRPALAAFAPGAPILIAGSTAAGEEEAVLTAYLKLRGAFRTLALIIAPRHLDRAPQAEAAIQAAGLDYVKAGELSRSGAESAAAAAPAARVMLLDTMGELGALYRRAAIAFVGGSLFAGRGGQNPAEPALAGVPVMFGPFHQNQREAARALLSCGGGFVVRDSREIAALCAELLADETRRLKAGQSARAAIERMGGAAAAALSAIKTLTNLQ